MRATGRQAVLHAALGLGAVVVLAPFAVMVATSLRAPGEELSGGLFPWPPSLESYRTVLREAPVARYWANGVAVSAATFVLQVAVCLPAAFALARLRFRGRRLGLGVVAACLMVPTQVVAVPVYVLLHAAGLLDTRVALVVPFVGSAFGIFLLRQFLLAVPGSVIDAARLDGAGTAALLWRVVFPLARPAVVAFGVFSVAGHWNDYFWASFVLRSDRAATVPVGVASFLDQEAGAGFGPQMAMATLAVVPLLAGFVLAQRRAVDALRFAGGDG